MAGPFDDEDFKLMADLVINHCSSESEWFKNFKEGKDPGSHYFVLGEDYEDVSEV